jgi:hypothetical protein
MAFKRGPETIKKTKRRLVHAYTPSIFKKKKFLTYRRLTESGTYKKKENRRLVHACTPSIKKIFNSLVRNSSEPTKKEEKESV